MSTAGTTTRWSLNCRHYNTLICQLQTYNTLIYQLQTYNTLIYQLQTLEPVAVQAAGRWSVNYRLWNAGNQTVLSLTAPLKDEHTKKHKMNVIRNSGKEDNYSCSVQPLFVCLLLFCSLSLSCRFWQMSFDGLLSRPTYYEHRET